MYQAANGAELSGIKIMFFRGQDGYQAVLPKMRCIAWHSIDWWRNKMGIKDQHCPLNKYARHNVFFFTTFPYYRKPNDAYASVG